MKKLWITGATGFLGKRILQSPLLEFFDVTVVTRGPKSDSIQVKQMTKFELLEGRHSADVILHAATEYGRNKGALQNTIDANLHLPLALIEIAGPTLENFIAIDSYYNKKEEIYSFLPKYCISKRLLMEWIDLEYKDLAVSRVFLEHVYGPNDRIDKFVPAIVSKLSRNETIELSSGTQLRDFVFVDDAASAVLKVARRNSVPGERMKFEIGTGVGTSINNFVRLAIEVLSSSSAVVNNSLTDRPNEIEKSVANLAEISKLDWSPSVHLREGLQLTFSTKR